MGKAVTNGLGTVLSAVGLLVPLPVWGGGGLSKVVANYLYPPPVNSLSDGVDGRLDRPVVRGESVSTPFASFWVNDHGKESLGITALPNELVVNILANLSIRDLLVCKHVCKNWQTLVTTVPALACAVYRSCHPPGSAPRLNDTVESYYGSTRQWLNSFSEQGSKAVTRLDGILENGGPHFPEQLFFAIARVLDEAPAFNCRKVCTIEHPDSVYSNHFSPDQQHLVTCSRHTIKICRPVDGCWQEVNTVWQSARIIHVYFSPDSKHLVAVINNDNAKIWQFANGQWQQRTDLYPIAISSRPVFNADSTYLAAIFRYNRFQIHKLIDGHWQPQTTALDNYWVWGARFHPKEHDLLATYYHNTVTLWRFVVGRWQQDGTLVHPFKVASIGFSPDGNRLMTYPGEPDQPGSEVLSIHLWFRVGREWRQEATLALTGVGYTAYFSPRGHHIVSPPGETHMEIWRRSGGQWKSINSLSLIPESCFSGCFSPDECNLATHSWTDSATVWRDRDGLLAQEAVIPCLPLPCISFSPDGNHLLVATDMETAMIWGIVDGRWQAKASLRHVRELHTIRFSPLGNYVLTTTWNGTVNIWTLNSQQ